MNSQQPGAFATTRWSTITRVWVDGPRARSGALAELGQRFRYPVYAYLRSAGRSPLDAILLASAFLDALEAAARRNDTVPREARFRRFLIERLDAWLATQIASPSRSQPTMPDALLEARYRRDARAADTPSHAFERAFALEVLARASANLEAEARENGHADMYSALVPWLSQDPPTRDVERIAASLRLRPLTVVVALKRLRQRLRELASAELADTVVSADEFASEQRALFAVLQAES